MRHDTYDTRGRLRVRRDDTTRTVTRWDEDGTVVDERAYTPQEVAAAQDAALDTTRQARYTTLLDRAQTAQQGNRDFLALTSVTTAQAVSQVKDLTRQNQAIMQLVLRLAGRAGALDAPD